MMMMLQRETGRRVATEQIDDIRHLGGIMARLERDFETADLQQVLEGFFDELEAQHEHYFQQQQNPVGEPWPPNAPSTIAKKGHDNVLHDTERLRRSLAGQTGDSIRETVQGGKTQGLNFGTDVPYSIFHDQGVANLPERVHVGIDEELAGDFGELIADRMVEQMKRSALA